MNQATSSSNASQTLGFQAEVKQLLHLMIHSLYSNKEIFLRELVSNASDACDKLRFEAIDQPDLMEGAGELHVRVDFDKAARTITISDNGVGLSRDEAVANLGTIARSGTRELCEALMEAVADQKRQLLEDDDYRLQEQKSQEQMEYEIRQSITRARALWRERNNKDAGEDEDDDNFDVDVEYVRD